MKLIKSLIGVISIFMCGLSFAGCDDTADTSTYMQQEEPTSAATDSLSSKEKQAVMDSISKLEDQIKAIDRSVKVPGNGISDLKKAASDAKMWFYITLGIAVLSLIIAVTCIIKLVNVQERVCRHRKDIDDLDRRIHTSISISQSNMPIRQTSKVGNEYYELANRINNLEHKVAQIQFPAATTPTFPKTVAVKTTTEQIGYFGVPSQISQTEAYFRKLIESASDSDVRFSATVRGNRAEFKPRDGMMSSLKSSDTMKLAVETTGCLLSDATSMKTLNPGEAELKDSRWVITKKALILLQK